MRLILVAVLAVSALSWEQAGAAQLRRVDEGATVLLSGTIERGDAARFAAMLRGRHVVRVWLDSRGGRVGDALEIAERIHAGGLDTLVGAGRRCASACFIIFAAGRTRHAGAQAQIGVHAANHDGRQDEGAHLATTEMLRHAQEYHVPADIMWRMVQTPPAQTRYLTPSDLAAMGVRPLP